MASLFISYSRRNIENTRRLADALKAQGLDFWIDWESIEPTVDWWREIQKGIEEADHFLFLLSPDSLSSKVCRQELAYAVQNGKRLIPVVVAEVSAESVPAELRSLNWIYLRAGDDYDTGFGRLIKALTVDFDWVQVHRRLQVKALEWERSQRERSFLLRGRDLKDAEAQIEAHEQKDPFPTGLQREYILASRQAAARQRVLTLAFALLGVAALAGAVYLFLVRPYQLRVQAQSEMVTIPGGPVVLGTNDPQASPEETPQWSTELGGFMIDRYEVSNDRFRRCVQAGACQEPNEPTQFNDPKYANYPVAGVTAFQADAFCRWLGQRLPTELEWERAARGPDGRLWPWGDTEPTSKTANLYYDDTVEGSLLPVNSLPEGASPAPERVYNLVGNVWEWTSSYAGQDGGYEHDPNQFWDSSVEKTPAFGLVQRGGSWDDNTMSDVTRRDSVAANDTQRQVGIRCAKSL